MATKDKKDIKDTASDALADATAKTTADVPVETVVEATVETAETAQAAEITAEATAKATAEAPKAANKKSTKKPPSKTASASAANDGVVYSAVGRRKTAIVRVRVKPGKGECTINSKPASDFLGTQQLYNYSQEPLIVSETDGQYDIIATSTGGGISGVAGALRLAIARALLKAGVPRETLKRGGYLTRDSRMVERKKYGLKKARKRPQFSKR